MLLVFSYSCKGTNAHVSSKPIADYIEIPDPDSSLQGGEKQLLEMLREANFTNVHAADNCVDAICKIGSFSN